MVYDGVLEGRYVDLKSVTVEDAEFTLGIRTDPELTKYLPRINNTLEQQVMWIEQQRRKPGDYFFVVWDKNGNRIGTMGIYDVHEKKAESGRLAVRGNALQAIETQMLCVDFAFEYLELDELYSYVLVGNESAIRCVRLFGSEVSEPVFNDKEEEVHNIVSRRSEYLKQKREIERMIYR